VTRSTSTSNYCLVCGRYVPPGTLCRNHVRPEPTRSEIAARELAATREAAAAARAQREAELRETIGAVLHASPAADALTVRQLGELTAQLAAAVEASR
jgi:hypothetical protein